MPMQPAEIADYLKGLEKRIAALERGSNRWGVTYKTEQLFPTLFRVDTRQDTYGVSFWGAPPLHDRPAIPADLTGVIQALTSYGLVG